MTPYARHYNFEQDLTIEQMYEDCLYHLYTADRRQNPYSIASINMYLFLKGRRTSKTDHRHGMYPLRIKFWRDFRICWRKDLMIVKMKFINISGPRNDIDRVTDLYLSRYEIQLESALSELKICG